MIDRERERGREGESERREDRMKDDRQQGEREEGRSYMWHDIHEAIHELRHKYYIRTVRTLGHPNLQTTNTITI